MFKELAPLLRHRAVLFTVSHVEDDQFRVNVIPKKIADGENDALTIPVSVSGTVEDLDKELPEILLHFVSGHLELKNSLERAQAEMEEASKAARVEARKKSGSQVTKKDPAGNSSKPAVAPEAPASAKAEAPRATSLFDAGPEPETDRGGEARAEGSATCTVTGSEIDEEEAILREAFESGDRERGEGA